jgi:pimeloyl-ACP methyl ester carboxylesterase
VRPRSAVGLICLSLVAACSDAGGSEQAQPSTTTSSSATTTAPPTTTTTAPATTTTAAPPPTTAPPPPPTTAAPPPAASPGTLAWKACGGLQCATLTVPYDYADPNGPTIGLAVARKPAGNPARRIGSLVLNPGGPGNSGIDGMNGNLLRSLTAALKARFDIVSWDPRGVSRSRPVRCEAANAPPADDSGPPLDPAPTTPEDQARLGDAFAAYGAACSAHSGDLLRVVGTDSTAEDLERLRIALGDERLSFIGHSSGTLIGSIYAHRYPQRVRAMVLDGPIDPSLSLDQMTLDQALAFERTLDEFFAWCLRNSCAWRPGPDLRAAFHRLLDRVRAHPLPAGSGRQLDVNDLITGVMGRLYAASRWPSLGDALAAAERNDGSPLAGLSDRYRDSGGSNAAAARQAINCADHPAPRDRAAYPALADGARSQAPVFGATFAWAALSCGVWPVEATLQPAPVRAAGAPPILVVGSVLDPATPRKWAESLAAQLEGGVLVLRNGVEHVAYFYSSCVRGLADAYLIDGRVPADPTTCKS